MADETRVEECSMPIPVLHRARGAVRAAVLISLVPLGCASLEADRAEDPDNPPDGPIDGQLVINDGASYTNTPEVAIVALRGPFATHLAIVEGEPDGVVEIPDDAFVTALTSFTLSEGDGPKYLYYQFRDLAGHRGSLGSFVITLDTTPPACILLGGCRGDWESVRWGYSGAWYADGVCPDGVPTGDGWCRIDPFCAPYLDTDYPYGFTGVYPDLHTHARNVDLYALCDDFEDTGVLRVAVTDIGTGAVANPQPYSDYFSYVLPAEGAASVAVRFTDPAGNETLSDPVTFVLDQQPPQAPRILTAPVVVNMVAASEQLAGILPTCAVGDWTYDDDFECQLLGFADCHEDAGVCIFAYAPLYVDPPGTVEANFGCYEVKGGDWYPDYSCALEQGQPPDSAFLPDSLTVALWSNAPNAIRVRSHDRAGNTSSDDLVVLVEDSVPPPRPENVRVSPENGAALVEWDEPSAGREDVAGYLLYYGTITGQLTGNFSQNGPSPVDVGLVQSFRLSGLQNNTDVFVAIESYDYTNVPGPNRSVRTKEVRIRPNETNPQLDQVYSYAVQDLLYDDGTGVLFASTGDATVMAIGADYPDTTIFAEEPAWTLPPGVGFGSQMALDSGHLYLAGGPLGLVTFCSDLAGVVGFESYGDWAAADVFPIASTAITHLAVVSDGAGLETLAYLGSANGMQIVDIVPPDCGEESPRPPRDPQVLLRLFGGRRIDAIASLPADSALGVPLVGVVADGGLTTLFYDLPSSPEYAILGPFSCTNDGGAPCSWTSIALTEDWLVLVSPDPLAGLEVYNLYTLNGFRTTEADLAGVLGLEDLASGTLRTAVAKSNPAFGDTDLFLIGESASDPGVGRIFQLSIGDDGSGGPSLVYWGSAWPPEVPRSLAIGPDKVYVNLGHYGIQPVDLLDISSLDPSLRIPVDVGGPANSEQILWSNGVILTAEGSGGISAIEDEGTTVDDIYEGDRFEWQVISPLYDDSDPPLIAGLDADFTALKNRVNDIELVGDTLFVAEDKGVQVFDVRPWQDRVATTRVGPAGYVLDPGAPVLELEVHDGMLVAVVGPPDAASLWRYDLSGFFDGLGVNDGDVAVGWPLDLTGLGTVVAGSLVVNDHYAYVLSRGAAGGAPTAGFLSTVDLYDPTQISTCEYNDPGRPADLALAGYEAYIVDELGLLHMYLPGHWDLVRTGQASSVGPTCSDALGDDLVSFLPLTGAGTSVRLAGPLTYVTTTQGLEILAFGAAGSLRSSGWAHAPLGAYDAAFDGTRMYLAGGRSGLLRMNLETRGKVAPWRTATVLGGIGRRVALDGRFAFVIDDEAGLSSYNYQLVVVDLSDSPLTPLWDAVGLPSYFAMGSGSPDVKFLDVDVYRDTLRMVTQLPGAPGSDELIVETYAIDGGFEPIYLATTDPISVAGLWQVDATFDDRYLYLTLAADTAATLYLYDLGDPTAAGLATSPLVAVDLSAYLPVGEPSLIGALSASAPVINNTIYYSVYRYPDAAEEGESVVEVVQVDVAGVLGGEPFAADDIQRTETALFYEHLALQRDRGLLIGSSRTLQRLVFYTLDPDDSPAHGDERYPEGLCNADTLYAGVLDASGRSVYTAMMAKGPADRPVSVGMQVFDLTFPDPGDRDAWPLGRSVPGDPDSPPLESGEGVECPLSFVRPANFIDRGGFDIAVEGPFVYLANERGLDVIDLR